ncbi:tripartite tricarboxylate transporter TctB family protein [Puniceibacterium sp. IMCC21224]|uniref:tripartite tricarboxylate transporter TctB family protein n=1 Tax=Puniceibacterium sp. IMCC21224 TaxID=1618204 RepID=UPI00064DFAE2|nr:tripartite tricarboxylate transporter TctB family protein [Puniceibacterium sp. IMCC21224]KMK65136.1 Tripartite tricarboxylate transporter TctB family [Puniceibacterium sp. IMCC21224]
MDEARKDILGGALLCLIGAGIALYCWANYDLGTLRRMGTGFYPMLTGGLLAGLGALIALPPLLRGTRPGAIPLPPMRASVFVLAAVSAFALLCRPFGLFPAIAALVALSTLVGPERVPLRDSLIMIAALCALAWGVFGLGLSLGLRMIHWPW